jgi:hypothetical protein
MQKALMWPADVPLSAETFSLRFLDHSQPWCQTGCPIPFHRSGRRGLEMLLALSGPASLTALSNAGWLQPDAALHLARAETGTPSPTKNCCACEQEQ